MYVDPDEGRSYEEIVNDLQKRNPALYRRASACAERAGQTLQEFAAEAAAELMDRLEGDPAALAAFGEKLARQEYPLGKDPLLSGGDTCWHS